MIAAAQRSGNEISYFTIDSVTDQQHGWCWRTLLFHVDMKTNWLQLEEMYPLSQSSLDRIHHTEVNLEVWGLLIPTKFKGKRLNSTQLRQMHSHTLTNTHTALHLHQSISISPDKHMWYGGTRLDHPLSKPGEGVCHLLSGALSSTYDFGLFWYSTLKSLCAIFMWIIVHVSIRIFFPTFCIFLAGYDKLTPSEGLQSEAAGLLVSHFEASPPKCKRAPSVPAWKLASLSASPSCPSQGKRPCAKGKKWV